MQRHLQYGFAAAAMVGFLASALPAEAQRGGGGARAGGGGGGRAAPTTMQRPSGGSQAGRVNSGNVNSGNRVNTGNVNTGNRVNTGNVNVGNSVNINVDNGWNGYGARPVQPIYRAPVVVAPVQPIYRPVATAAVVGAAVAVTAAAVGSRVYVLPGGCNPYPYASYTYYSCGNVWYKPAYQGTSVTYVVVAKPF